MYADATGQVLHQGTGIRTMARAVAPAASRAGAMARVRGSLAVALVLVAFPCAGQLSLDDPDWREDLRAGSQPPAFVRDRLLPIAVAGSALRYGIDPATVSIGPDRVVRYVVVAQSAGGGAVNALYEGIRCNKAEVKIHARYSPDSGWVPVVDAEWKPLHGNGPGRHSLLIARGGACVGNASNGTAAQVVRDLAASPDMRFLSN